LFFFAQKLSQRQMENNKFYVKYQNKQPIKVETHIDIQRGRREFPLDNVGHLVAAYKTAVAPLLDSTPADELTLHCISNGLETNYNFRDPLTVLGQNKRLGTNPLIIRYVNDTISMDEYMRLSLPHTAQTPTVQSCLSYVNCIVNHDHMDSPATSKRPSTAGSATQISRPSSPKVSLQDSFSRGDSPFVV
jgi:hypothetical protein